MRLEITHRTRYRYDAPIIYALQRLRLVPGSDDCQVVVRWDLSLTGAKEEVAYIDPFGNQTALVSVSDGAVELEAVATGLIDTVDKSGIVGRHRGYAPLWLFDQETDLTRPGEALAALARDIPAGQPLDRLHALLKLVVDRVEYVKGATNAATPAEDALLAAKGVCQDQAHIFIAASRLIGLPSRYVSGYLLLDDGEQEGATHAWAESHVDGLGWVSFDPANGISTDARYVRLATGRDYQDAAPISGFRLGDSSERLEVDVSVAQKSGQ